MKLALLCLILSPLSAAPLWAQSGQFTPELFGELAIDLPALEIPATPGQWVCTFSNKGSDWVPDTVVIQLTNQTSAEITGPILKHFGQSPTTASVYRNDSRALGLGWRLNSPRDKQGRRDRRLNYALKINKQRNKASLTVEPSRYDNFFNGRGVCQRR